MAKSTYGEGSIWHDEKRDLWFGQVSLGGKRPRVSARSKTDMLIKLAKLQEREVVCLNLGQTTADWIDHWTTQAARQVESSTHEDYVRWARLYVKPYVGAIPLDALSPEDVEDMMSALEAKGLAPKTVRLARTLLVSALDVAQARGKVTQNVARLTKGPKRVKPRINDRLDVEGAKAVLDVLSGDRLYALAVVALFLGVRPGELFGLQWSAVNFTARTITIQSGLKRNKVGWYLKGPKTEAGKRTLPLPESVLDALQAHQVQQREIEKLTQRNGFVFCDLAGEPLKARDVLAWWHEATIKAGVGRRRFYCSRHTAATLMLNNGVSLEVVSKILGHSGYAITSDVYAEVREELQREAANVMDGVLGG
jgi:integrase